LAEELPLTEIFDESCDVHGFLQKSRSAVLRRRGGLSSLNRIRPAVARHAVDQSVPLMQRYRARIRVRFALPPAVVRLTVAVVAPVRAAGSIATSDCPSEA
jgi:hypothetical protein